MHRGPRRGARESRGQRAKRNLIAQQILEDYVRICNERGLDDEYESGGEDEEAEDEG